MIERFVLMARDVAGLSGFYCRALGFLDEGGGRLRLGAQRVDVLAATGPAYPAVRASNDPWFQHFAIVVSDIGAAYRRVVACGGLAISVGGPQVLPESSGGVSAWKFRDPEGHPLELLAFPAGRVPEVWRGEGALFRGIDHSAIVVAETGRSVAFYARFGFGVAEQTVNRGGAQAALDGLDGPDVLVTALLVAGQAAPHLELLEYRAPVGVGAVGWDVGDVVATRVRLVGGGAGWGEGAGHCREGVAAGGGGVRLIRRGSARLPVR